MKYYDNYLFIVCVLVTNKVQLITRNVAGLDRQIYDTLYSMFWSDTNFTCKYVIIVILKTKYVSHQSVSFQILISYDYIKVNCICGRILIEYGLEIILCIFIVYE